MQRWRDGQVWVQAHTGGEAGAGGLGALRRRQWPGIGVAALVLLTALLFVPGLVAELRLRSLEQPGTLGPLVAQPATVRGVALQQVAGARPPIYFGDAVPLEKVQWVREGVQIAWRDVPRITGLRQPGEESPVFVFGDHDEYLALGRRLWGSRFGQLGWETCTFVGGLAVLQGATGTACDAGRVDSRDSFVAVLAHELTHQLVNAEWMRGSTVPRWFNEGLAGHVEDEVYKAHASVVPARGLGSGNYVAHALRAERYQRLEQLTWASTDERYVSYAYAHSRLAVGRMVERFGMNAVADVVRKSGPKSFDDTFADVLGLGLAAFEAELEGSLRSTLLAPGLVLYQDDFAQPGRRWRRSWGEGTYDPLAYEGGEFTLRVTAESEPTQAVWNRLPFGDFHATVDARLVQPVEGAAVFLDFRIQANDQWYRFSVAPDSSRFALQQVTASGATPLVEGTALPAIKGGTAANRLGVRADGGDVVLLVNDAEVGRAHELPFREGRVGFGVSSPRGEPTEARFGNLVVNALN
jgi:hypothetical protein